MEAAARIQSTLFFNKKLNRQYSRFEFRGKVSEQESKRRETTMSAISWLDCKPGAQHFSQLIADILVSSLTPTINREIQTQNTACDDFLLLKNNVDWILDRVALENVGFLIRTFFKITFETFQPSNFRMTL